MRLCWLMIVLGACIDTADLESRPAPVDAPLAGAPVVRIDVGDPGLSVTLTNQNEYSMPCPRLLPSFVATLDGMAMRVERGFVDDEGLDSPEYVCRLPDVNTGTSGRSVHLADDSAVIDVDLGDAMQPRTVQTSATTLARGDSFDVTWSSSEDLANATRVDVEIVLGTFYATLPSQIVAGSIHATMPSTAQLPATGNAGVYVTVVSSRPCSYANCSVHVSRTALQAVTVQ